MSREAPLGPTEVGLKATPICCVWPGVRVTEPAGPEVIWNWLAPEPERPTPLMVRFSPPAFLTVTVWEALAAPFWTSLKTRRSLSVLTSAGLGVPASAAFSSVILPVPSGGFLTPSVT
jgi:hypothetical protein